MSAAALVRRAFPRRQLLEMVVELWHDHFNVSGDKDDIAWMLSTDDREVYRPLALGRFEDLLLAVAKSPSMLAYGCSPGGPTTDRR